MHMMYNVRDLQSTWCSMCMMYNVRDLRSTWCTKCMMHYSSRWSQSLPSIGLWTLEDSRITMNVLCLFWSVRIARHVDSNPRSYHDLDITNKSSIFLKNFKRKKVDTSRAQFLCARFVDELKPGSFWMQLEIGSERGLSLSSLFRTRLCSLLIFLRPKGVLRRLECGKGKLFAMQMCWIRVGEVCTCI